MNSYYNCYISLLRLRGRHLVFNIIFGDVIIVLANRSITTCGITSLSVSLTMSSLKLYQKLLLSCVGILSLSKFTACTIK